MNLDSLPGVAHDAYWLGADRTYRTMYMDMARIWREQDEPWKAEAYVRLAREAHRRVMARLRIMRAQHNAARESERHETTACWRCNASYPINRLTCPKCDASNGNTGFDAAVAQMEARS